MAKPTQIMLVAGILAVLNAVIHFMAHYFGGTVPQVTFVVILTTFFFIVIGGMLGTIWSK